MFDIKQEIQFQKENYFKRHKTFDHTSLDVLSL